MGQKIGDTVEEEGIAYSISYVAADVAIQILLSKGLGEVKNVSKADDLVDVARTVDTLRTHLRRVEFDWGGFARNLVMGLAVGAACIALAVFCRE